MVHSRARLEARRADAAAAERHRRTRKEGEVFRVAALDLAETRKPTAVPRNTNRLAEAKRTVPARSETSLVTAPMAKSSPVSVFPAMMTR
jgi:hypothetical protein